MTLWTDFQILRTNRFLVMLKKIPIVRTYLYCNIAESQQSFLCLRQRMDGWPQRATHISYSIPLNGKILPCWRLGARKNNEKYRTLSKSKSCWVDGFGKLSRCRQENRIGTVSKAPRPVKYEV